MEGIRPNSFQEMTAFKGSQDCLNALDQDDQGRLLTLLIQARLDVLVHTSEHIRAHIVI